MSFHSSACDVHLTSEPQGATSLVAICNNEEGSGRLSALVLDELLGNKDGKLHYHSPSHSTSYQALTIHSIRPFHLERQELHRKRSQHRITPRGTGSNACSPCRLEKRRRAVCVRWDGFDGACSEHRWAACSARYLGLNRPCTISFSWCEALCVISTSLIVCHLVIYGVGCCHNHGTIYPQSFLPRGIDFSITMQPVVLCFFMNGFIYGSSSEYFTSIWSYGSIIWIRLLAVLVFDWHIHDQLYIRKGIEKVYWLAKTSAIRYLSRGLSSKDCRYYMNLKVLIQSMTSP